MQRTFTITVNALNDAPVFDAINGQTVNEDAPTQTVSITNLGPGGGPDELGQTVTLTALSSDPAFVPNPTIIGTGTTRSLSYTPTANGNGVVTVTVTAADGQSQNNSFQRTFTITVNAVNDVPVFDIINDQTVNEDASTQTISITNVGPGGGADELGQTVTLTAVSSNPAVVPNPIITGTGATRSLSYTPAPNANGVVTVTVTADDGQPPNNTFQRTFTITVNALNDTPVFDTINDQTVNEEAPTQTVSITNVGPGGGADELGQTATLTAVSSNPAVVSSPTITGTGATQTLSYTPTANANGVVTVTVTVDDGQTQNNTLQRTFTITVNAVNDAPFFDTITDQFVPQNAPEQTVSITNVGPGGGADEAGQTVTMSATSDNPALVPNPTISVTASTRTLTYAPVTGISGTAIITVTADDGQVQNHFLTRTFSVFVSDASNPPPAVANPIADLTVNEDAALVLNYADLNTVFDDPNDPDGALTYTVTANTPSGIVSAVIQPGGTLDLGFVTNQNGVVDITVRATDPDNLSAQDTFRVTVNAVNDAPVFDTISDQTVNEDAPTQTVSITNVGPGGGADEPGQTVTLSAVSSNPAIVPNPIITGMGATRTLGFTPVANANGVVTITVIANDGQLQNNTFQRTFTITVNAVNDAPFFDPIANQVVPQNAPAQTVAVTNVGSGGGGDESGQTVTMTATSDNPGLVPNPIFSGTGSARTLSYAPVAGVSGTAIITVTANDGQAQNRFFIRTFSVVVSAANLPVPLPRPDHIVLVIEENHDFSEIIGSPFAPFINSLALQGALMTASTAVEHPSQPNYLDLFSGSNQGVVTDARPAGLPFTTPNLGDALLAAGFSFVGFSESLPSVGFDGDSFSTTPGQNQYVRKHNPWANWVNDPAGPNQLPSSVNQPFTSFPTDFSQLPTVAIVIPNEQNDMHDGSIQAGNDFLKNNLDVYVQWAKLNNSLLIVTWDENDDSPGNHIPAIFVGPMVGIGSSDGQAINHFNVLRTIEDMYGLPAAGASADATPITSIFHAVNDQPVFDAVGDQAADEDSGSHAVSITGVGPSARPDEPGQTVTLAATSSDPGVVPNPIISGTGATRTLTYTPVANANGVVTITVTATDNGGTSNGGVDTFQHTFTITVNAVNDAPLFDIINDQTINEDSPTQTVSITNLSPGGGPDESGQTVALSAVSSNPAVVPNPTISGTGATRTLTYTPAPNANGVVTVTVTANDGQSQKNSIQRTFTITVNAVNDAPFFGPIANQLVAQNSRAQTVSVTDVSTGGGTDEAGQTVTITATSNNPSLVPNPTFSGTGNARTLTYAPVAGKSGTAIITVTANDGQAQNRFFTRTFSVVVSAAAHAPVARTDAVLLRSAASITVNVLANDSDADGDHLKVTAVTQPPSGNGIVTINVNGTLTYKQTVFVNGAERFTYSISDGHGGTATAAVTVSVNLPATVGVSILLAQVNTSGLSQGLAVSLTAKLSAEQLFLTRGNTRAAINILLAFANDERALQRVHNLASGLFNLWLLEVGNILAVFIPHLWIRSF